MITIKTLMVAAALVATLAPASAQGGRYYDDRGNFLGTSDNDPNDGPTHYYDAQGNMTGTSSISGRAITFYDARGNVRSRVTWPQPISINDLPFGK